MKNIKLILITLVFAIIWLGAMPKETISAEQKIISHVFLISVGGLNQEGYSGNSLPNLKQLMLEGTSCEKTFAVRTDTMEAAEATLLTGALASEHKHLTVNDKVEVESMLDVLKKHGRSMLVVDGSGGKLHSFAYGEKEYRQLDSQATSKEVIAEALKSFSQNKPFFTYVYLDDCTEALLRSDQDEYYKSLKAFDTQMAVFLKWLKDSGLYENSLIVVTSARSTSPSNQVPLIIFGPGAKVNSNVSGAMIIDVAPTICRLIGLESPVSGRGFPIYGALSVNEEGKPALTNSWIKDLQKDRQANWNTNYGLEDELNRTIRQMASIKEEKQSVFDFAGEREQTIIDLKSKIFVERAVWIGIVLLMLAGYVGEFIYLKRKYLLFK